MAKKAQAQEKMPAEPAEGAQPPEAPQGQPEMQGGANPPVSSPAEKPAEPASSNAVQQEESPAQRRARLGAHPSGFQNQKPVLPVPSRMNPKKANPAKK
jgi:hypothetical protein